MVADQPPGWLGMLGGELTGFVGRRGELAGVREALAGARLVTLTGPGGIGKTRLAVRAAAEMRRGSATVRGWWSWLACGMLRCWLRRSSGRWACSISRRAGGVAALAERLAGRQILLVVDN